MCTAKLRYSMPMSVCLSESALSISDLCVWRGCFHSDGWGQRAVVWHKRWAAASAPCSMTTHHPEMTDQTRPLPSVHTPGYMAKDLHTHTKYYTLDEQKSVKTIISEIFSVTVSCLWKLKWSHVHKHVIGWNKPIWRICTWCELCPFTHPAVEPSFTS